MNSFFNAECKNFHGQKNGNHGIWRTKTQYLSTAGLLLAVLWAGLAPAATYTWVQAGDLLQWDDSNNWQGGAVIPQAEVNAALIFGQTTSGDIGTNPNSARVTFGSIQWETPFVWKGFGSYTTAGCITVDTGGSMDAYATFSNNATMSAYYGTWLLNNDLVLSGSGALGIQACGETGVSGSGGFRVESGSLLFLNTHGSENYIYTGGVTVKSGGTVRVDTSMGALGDGQFIIEEGATVLANNSFFNQDVHIIIHSASNSTAFITRGGSNWNTAGTWSFDLADAGTAVGSSWTLVDMGASITYDQTLFNVAGYSESSPGLWTGQANGATYQYNEATGVLSVVAPTVPESTPPTIVSLTPANNSTNVLREANLVAKFDEPIAFKSGGTISITDLSDGTSTTIITLEDDRITSPKGNDMSINLDEYLEPGTEYSVQISADAITDGSLTPNAFSGLLTHTNWTFTTEFPETIPPTITPAVPADEATGILPWVTLEATFDEAVLLKDGGQITLKDLTDGSGTEIITLPDSRVTSPNGDDLRIDLVYNLEFGTDYAVRFSADAIEDRAATPNPFPGIQDDVTWNFSTKADAAEIHNILLVTIELADVLPNVDIITAENIMFNDELNIDDGFRVASYGRMGLHLGDQTGMDPTVALRYLDTTKKQAGTPNNLRERAQQDLIDMGYTLSNFRFLLYIVPPGFNNASGVATVGGQWSTYQLFTKDVIMHELGHCLGGNHSRVEPGCALGWANWNFSPEKKIKFGWMDAFPGTVVDVSTNTELRLVPLCRDPAELSGTRVARVASPGNQMYHISYRVSEEPYSKLHDPELYTEKVFVSLDLDHDSTYTSNLATLASGQTFTDGNLIVTCNRVADDGLSADVTLAFNTFATWAETAGLAPDEQGFMDDPDGDGLVNGIEAWLGTHPNQFNSGLFAGSVDLEEKTFSITHGLNESPVKDLAATYQWSSDLKTFYNDGESNSNGTTTVSFSSGDLSEGMVSTTATISGSEIPSKLFVGVNVAKE